MKGAENEMTHSAFIICCFILNRGIYLSPSFSRPVWENQRYHTTLCLFTVWVSHLWCFARTSTAAWLSWDHFIHGVRDHRRKPVIYVDDLASLCLEDFLFQSKGKNVNFYVETKASRFKTHHSEPFWITLNELFIAMGYFAFFHIEQKYICIHFYQKLLWISYLPTRNKISKMSTWKKFSSTLNLDLYKMLHIIHGLMLTVDLFWWSHIVNFRSVESLTRVTCSKLWTCLA